MPPTRKRMNPVKCYTVTLFDYPEGYDLWMPDHMVYAIWQEECCPTTGRTHVQGYFVLKKKQRRTTVSALFGDLNPHLEVAGGTWEQNVHYCTKPVAGCDCSHCKDCPPRVSGPFEHGKKPKQGSAKLMEGMWDAISAGTDLYDVVAETPALLRYPQAMKMAQSLYLRRKGNQFRHVKVTVLVGGAGVGKSRWPLDKHGYADTFILTKDEGQVWWDGYEGQSVLVLDDFHTDWNLRWTTMLRWLDGYPMRLNVKGTSAWACFTHVYITSNLPMQLWYPEKEGAQREPLMRRIDEIIEWRVFHGEYRPMRKLRDGVLGLAVAPEQRNTTPTTEIDELMQDLDLVPGSGMMGNTGDPVGPPPASLAPIIPLSRSHATVWSRPELVPMQVQDGGGGGSSSGSGRAPLATSFAHLDPTPVFRSGRVTARPRAFENVFSDDMSDTTLSLSSDSLEEVS